MENFVPGITPSTGWNTLAGACLSGVLLHQTFLRRGEWHSSGLSLIFSYSALTLALLYFAATPNFTIYNVTVTPVLVIKALLCHFVGLVASLTVYRAVFHPLRHFPGPLSARFSNFYRVYLSWNLRVFEETYKLHQQHGDIVRVGKNSTVCTSMSRPNSTGPNELSLASPEAVKKVHWPQATPGRGPWYDQSQPRTSLLTSRDYNEHARLRKIWDRGFNAKALRNYSPRVQAHTARLQDVFEQNLNQTLNLTQWFNYYSFDVMGDLAFGKSFDMLIGGKDHYFLSVLHHNMKMVGLLGPVYWVTPILIKTPVLNRQSNRFWEFIGGEVRSRIENPPKSPDVFHWVLEGYGDERKTKRGFMNLEAEAELIIVAGSDTTATTLTNSIFELLTHPDHITLLRTEFSTEIGKDMTSITPDDLVKLPHLNAIINETLRLHPPVPSGVQRKIPPQGIEIGEVHIPGNTITLIPFYTLFRDERCFEHPHSFIPERWTSKPELNHDSSVFIPFSHGSFSCVGKQLGLMELRWVLTMMVTQYDISFAPGYDSSGFEKGAMDGFTMICAPLEVRLSKRMI
ncbi:cytochrome p450 monooxygenase [Aspergillus karnatakaensis]|uniref:cytochrome P450 n=1 Tax=Aspergillus karnatakaensis TaxID=1810916 RepID=UPI003CCDDC67